MISRECCAKSNHTVNIYYFLLYCTDFSEIKMSIDDDYIYVFWETKVYRGPEI